MLQRPQDFWYRAMTRAGSQERPLPGPPAALFAGNLGRMALAFHFRGDQAWINTVAEEPFLDPVTGAFLLAGLAVAGVLILRGSTRWALVVLSLFVLTLASTLALAFPVENPGINRAAVAMPSVLVLAGLPAVWLLRRARERGRGLALAVTGGVLAALGAVSLQQNYESYFVRFRHEQVMILEPTMDLVRVMREHRDTRGVPFDNVYLLNTTNWIDGRCIDFEIGDRLWSGPHDLPPGRPCPSSATGRCSSSSTRATPSGGSSSRACFRRARRSSSCSPSGTGATTRTSYRADAPPKENGRPEGRPRVPERCTTISWASAARGPSR